MPSLQDARRLSQLDHGLATVATVRIDGTAQLTVVNAGIVTHPVASHEVCAFVARRATRKLRHLRNHPTATLLWRAGWSWIAVEGATELCGPDDPLEGVDPATLEQLMRDIAAAGGLHQDDWTEYDRMVRSERRTAVLLTPRRIYQNP